MSISIEHPYQPPRDPSSSPLGKIIIVLGVLFVLGLFFIGLLIALTPAGQGLVNGINQLFAADSIQLWWYVTRAAGIVAYLLLWFSMVWGLGVTSKFFDLLLDRSVTYDFHQFISLLSIGFVLLHVAVLTVDRYLPYSAWQILVPFLSPYRPVWVGIGVIAFYILLLVTVTFYLRERIGGRAFRAIHLLSLIGYLGVTLHGLYAGTDSPLPAMQWLYKGTALVVIFLTVYWLALLAQHKMGSLRQTAAPEPARKRRVPQR